MELILAMLGGAIGGNLAGKLSARIDQGAFANSVAGVAGGGGVGVMLGLVGADGFDLLSLGRQAFGGSIGGGVALALFGVLRNMGLR